MSGAAVPDETGLRGTAPQRAAAALLAGGAKIFAQWGWITPATH